ncbi:hypothetical protein [Phytohabitans suffuscus]|uniref:hypothetical protein n=1 Tax=Phytohabitans suffuscus TaxID=624315 RepID=UPI0038CD9FDA
MLETALPLTATAVCGITLGLAASAAVASSTGQRWTGPDPAFLLTAVAGLLLTLALSSATLPLVKSITEPTTVRFE